MESLAELQSILKWLDARWHSGDTHDPTEIVKLDRRRKELKRKIQALKDMPQPISFNINREV